MLEYRVVPFGPGITEREASGERSQAAADRLERVITEHRLHGWDYVRYESIQTTVNPGCLTFFQDPCQVNGGVVVFAGTRDSDITPPGRRNTP